MSAGIGFAYHAPGRPAQSRERLAGSSAPLFTRDFPDFPSGRRPDTLVPLLVLITRMPLVLGDTPRKDCSTAFDTAGRAVRGSRTSNR